MSINMNVTNAAEQMMDAYIAQDMERYERKRENYFNVLEHEIMIDNGGGWIDLENPVDNITDTIANIENDWHPETEAQFLKWLLRDYIRFYEILEFHGLGQRDDELIKEARHYIEIYC